MTSTCFQLLLEKLVEGTLHRCLILQERRDCVSASPNQSVAVNCGKERISNFNYNTIFKRLEIIGKMVHDKNLRDLSDNAF